MEDRPTSGDEIRTLRELIDQRSAERGDGSFLVSPETGRNLTFAGLQTQSRLLDAQLRELGLQPGDKVAFLMDNGVFTAQLFLGVMYGGFVAVPLNVRAGVSQLAYTLAHCEARVVFAEAQYDALLRPTSTARLRRMEPAPRILRPSPRRRIPRC
jgi:acyl-CoA synthetase (AMP-forming)/AMP-acid ligase II